MRNHKSLTLFVLAVSALLISACSSAEAQSPVATSTPPVPASISGQVWHDLCAATDGEEDVSTTSFGGCVRTADGNYEANGLLEVGESGIGGVVVTLGEGACPSACRATTTTGADGTYVFTLLNAGTYCVSVDALSTENESLLPGGWIYPALEAGESVAGYTIIVGEGEQRSDVNFGWDYQFLPLPETVEPQPTDPVQPQPSPVVGCTDQVSFVGDVTIPDGAHLSPGESFVKTWRLRNSGTCAWTKGYSLVFVGGDVMGGAPAVDLPGTVPPGSIVDLSVNLVAPTANGTYEGHWQLRNAAGVLFDPETSSRFWVKIIVGPTPAPTPIVQPTVTPAVSYPALEIDLWDLPDTERCAEGMRYKSIYIRGQGGDKVYTYYWNGEKIAGPTGR